MPLDSLVSKAKLSQDWGLKRVFNWELKLCWFPKRCFLSKKTLWGRRAYYGENWITGPGEPDVQSYWIDRHEFLIWQIKRDH